MKKILIFYADVGLGHKTAAENIGWNLQRAGYEIQLENILKVADSRLARFSRWLHSLINRKIPWLWAFMYLNKTFIKINLFWRVPLAKHYRAGVLLSIDKFKPDVIISDHAVSSAVICGIKQTGEFRGLFGITFCDYHLHPFWLYKEADFYLANIMEQKEQMVQMGLNPEKIFVCGMALQPIGIYDVPELKKRFGINPNQRTIIVNSGSLGLGVSKSFVRDLSARLPKEKIIVVCGKNRQILDLLEKSGLSKNITVLGMYKPIQEIYAIADILVSKPGGLTVAESLQFNLPLIINHWLAGQEELNFNYLIKRKLIIDGRQDVINVVSHELASGEFKKTLSDNPYKKEIVGTIEKISQALDILCA